MLSLGSQLLAFTLLNWILTDNRHLDFSYELLMIEWYQSFLALKTICILAYESIWIIVGPEGS